MWLILPTIGNIRGFSPNKNGKKYKGDGTNSIVQHDQLH